MRRLWLACLAGLAACAHQPPPAALSTSSNCLADALREQRAEFPIGGSAASVTFGRHYDAGAFTVCMVAAGYAPAGVPAESLLAAARSCVAESSAAADAEAAYDTCLQRYLGTVTVEDVPQHAAH